MYRNRILATLLATSITLPSLALAEDYVMDTAKAHSFIQFRIRHLGFSWLLGRFNNFEGKFHYDEARPSTASVEVTIDTSSIDSNHAERDKHLRGKDFLNVDKFPQARFVSTAFEENSDGTGRLSGQLTLHGVTRPVIIDVKPVGHGPDPWGGYRRGFEGSTSLTLTDFGIDYNLGPAARQVELFLSVEGIRQ